MLGEVIAGRYRIIRLLGQGGMGAVYEAEQVETGQRVALKCIEEGLLLRGKSSVGRFQREAKATSAIDTEHIVRLIDAGADPKTTAPYMAMELLEGEDLQHLLDRVGCLEPATALRIAAQVCLGLQKAHEARVIHRDIKPSNIFLARRGTGEIVVKILDFGIAKIKRDPTQGGPTTGLTRTGGIIGSPLYMSPEQARGIKEIDFHTDIWSLGQVLYSSLSGKRPHEGIEAFGDLIMAICTELPRPVQDLAPWVKPEVAAVVHGALQLDAGDRFPTAMAMLDAIRPLLPEGWALREDDLVPVGEETRATKAPRLPLPRPAGDARRRVVRVTARGRSIEETDTVEETSTDARERSVNPSATTAEATVTTSDRDPPPPPAGTGEARSRARRSAAVGAAITAIVGLASFGLYAAWPRRERPMVAELSTSVVNAVPPPPALPASSAPESAPAPTSKRVKLLVSPSDVSVEIEGQLARVEGGSVEIEGSLGSVHHVRLFKGSNEVRGEVIVTEAGAAPARMELDTARPRAAGPPGSAKAAAPKATAQPISPKPPSSGDTVIPDKFN